jgi:hypothetical protein
LRRASFLFNSGIGTAVRYGIGSRSGPAVWHCKLWMNCQWKWGVNHMPLPARLPPNPPDPRMKTVDWFSKIRVPDLSRVSTMEVTAAAFPLSSTSKSLQTRV